MTDPVTTRGRLAAELRRLRSGAELNQRQVAEAMDWSPSKLHRVERGDVSISVIDLRALLGFYGLTDRAAVAALVELARESRKRMAHSTYRDILPPEVIRYLGYEAAAATITEVALSAVPGLLQTEEIGRAHV